MGPMLRWFVFTIGFGLLPFGFAVLLDRLHDPSAIELNNSPELLFFCVMTSAVEMGAIFTTLAGKPELPVWRSSFLGVMFPILLLMAIMAAALYGIYIDQERAERFLLKTDCTRVCANGGHAGLDALDFQTNLFKLSLWLSGLLAVAATLTEWVRTRRSQ